MNVFLLFLIFKLSSQRCGFKAETPKYKLEEPNNLRRMQSGLASPSTPFTPIRIFFDYTTLDNQSDVPISEKENIKKILSITKLIYERLLLVQRFNFNLRIRACDGRISIGSTVSTTGVNADLVIFPFVDNSPSGSTQAYASGCVLAASNNRPVAGIIGFTKNLDTAVGNWMEYFVSLAVHEIGHILLFNPSIFDLFIDKDWNQIPVDKVIKKEVINGLERNLLITPKVVEAARRHFNCSNLIGVELENQGGSGTSGSHWEARVMLSDIMIGVSYDEAVLSEITLALYEDSGWYKTNSYTGGLFRYGKNQGCGFLTKKCTNNGTSDYPNEFCSTGAYSNVCTAGYLSKGICYITEMEKALDSPYRYFNNPFVGGYRLADYCPIAAVPTNSSYYYPYSCSSGLSKYPSGLEEVISRDSLCFLSTLIRQDKYNELRNRYGRSDNAVCYTYDCDYENNKLQVVVGNSYVICPQQGGYVVVPGYVGTILCPRYDRVCTGTSKCNNMIDCIIDRVLPNNITLAVISDTNTNSSKPNNTDDNTLTPNLNPITANTPVSPVSPVSTPVTPQTTPTSPTPARPTTTQQPNPTNNPVVFIESPKINLPINILYVLILMLIL